MQSGSAIKAEAIQPAGAFRVFGGGGVRGWTDEFTHEGTYPLVGRQGARCGNVQVVRGRFFATEHAVVCTPLGGVDPRWLGYYLSTMELRQHSLAAAQPGLSVERLARLPALRPSDRDQRLLAKFLDYAATDIGRARQAKNSLVARLLERRRAIAQAIATAGVAPSGATKPSGIEWLGEVPSHWDIWPAKFLFREEDERSRRGEEQLMSVSHITGVTTRASKNVTMFQAADYTGHKLCRPGDLVINTMWAWMGALGVARDPGIVSPAYGVYRPLADSPLTTDYADLLLRSQPYIDEYTCRSTGIRSSRLRLYPDRFLRVPVVCPPIEEQQAIVDRVRTATEATDVAIAATSREVELLEEYRTRLISDVIAGRRDVRAEAALLPDIDPEELESLASDPHEDFDDEQV